MCLELYTKEFERIILQNQKDSFEAYKIFRLAKLVYPHIPNVSINVLVSPYIEHITNIHVRSARKGGLEVSDPYKAPETDFTILMNWENRIYEGGYHSFANRNDAIRAAKNIILFEKIDVPAIVVLPIVLYKPNIRVGKFHDYENYATSTYYIHAGVSISDNIIKKD